MPGADASTETMVKRSGTRFGVLDRGVCVPHRDGLRYAPESALRPLSHARMTSQRS